MAAKLTKLHARKRNVLAKSQRKPTQRFELEYKSQQEHHINYQKTFKPLLPIKTKAGEFISRSNVKTVQNDPTIPCHEMETKEDSESLRTTHVQEEISFTVMLMKREEIIERQKMLIGVTCASIQESPETKVEKLSVVLDLIADRSPTGEKNFLVIRKLALISVAELFKDIIPEYKLGILDAGTQKLKKTTIARVNYESKLLQQYKIYLDNCVNFSKLPQKPSRSHSEEEFQLAEIAIQCMCDLLMAHPYFNYSINTAQVLVTLLDNNVVSVRKRVYESFVTIFKTDSRYDLSQHIVRNINRTVKKSGANVHSEMISCLKYLPIIECDIDSETAREKKLQKLEMHKSRLINMSKKERKRKKKLRQLENELFETRADENMLLKTRKKADLTKLVFTILFRVLKITPASKLLSAALETLAKFAHAINIDFFSDLIELLNDLLNSKKLGYREELHCIQTVFSILKGQGEIMNIDPVRFYSHLYKNLLTIHAGINHDDFQSILTTLDGVLLTRRNNITYYRCLAFLKRLSVLSLQLLHPGSLGCLGVIKSAMALNSSLDVILDTETVIGSGKYNSELDDPDYSCANCSNLYELSALHRHYHPCVKRLSNNIANGTPSTGPGALPIILSKMSVNELYNHFDSSKMVFNPSVPSPIFDTKRFTEFCI